MMAAGYLSYKSDLRMGAKPATSLILAVMQLRPSRRKRQHPARHGIPRVFEGVGIGIVLIFLLWALAMVFLQVWQAIQTHSR
jgi:hypothetical protein